MKTGILKYILFLFSTFVYTNLFSQVSFLQHTLFSLSGSPTTAHTHFFLIANNTNFTTLPVTVADTSKKKDRDGDGVTDSLDKCPNEKGVIQYDGCPIPDTDNDGISDEQDQCPTIAGLAKYNGCPPPDKDGDKINDEDDKCPNQPGVARYNGCPVGDRDDDGVNDDDDKCIDVKGTAINAGCPENKKNVKPAKAKSRKG